MNSIEVFLRTDGTEFGQPVDQPKVIAIKHCVERFGRCAGISVGVCMCGFLPDSGHFSLSEGDSSSFSKQSKPLTKFILKPLSVVLLPHFFLSGRDNRTFETENYMRGDQKRLKHVLRCTHNITTT